MKTLRHLLGFCYGIVAVHLGDEVQRDSLGAYCLAFSVVGTISESKFVHFFNHRYCAPVFFRGSLRQIVQMRDFCRCKQHCSRVRAGCHAGSAAYACCSVHCLFNGVLGYKNFVRVLSGTRACGNETASLLDLVQGVARHNQVFFTGNGPALQGSTTIVSPSLNLRMCNWHTVVRRSGPCGMPLIVIEHIPQMPSRQSWSNAIGSLFSATSCSFKMSNISRKELSGLTLSTVYFTKRPFSLLFFCVQTLRCTFI